MQNTNLEVGRTIDLVADELLRDSAHLTAMPSARTVEEIMRSLRSVVFYDVVPCCDFAPDNLRLMLYDIYIRMLEQITLGARVNGVEDLDAREAALKFVAFTKELRRLLYTDVDAIMHNDPAARTPHEVVASYPAITALLHYRAAHYLHTLGVPVVPRIITELAHSATGVDIHPGAVIGEYFGIDHGTGVVIGETCIIGKHVTLYQGVTLGARNFEYDSDGNPMNVARHPIIEDNVTIYSNTSVLGRITVGHDTVIGGNVWLTHSVPPRSRVLQGGVRTNHSSEKE